MILLASFVGDALRWLASLFAQHGYLIMAALIAGESAGLPLPGETSLLAGAVAAQRGALGLGWVIAVGAAAAIVGDNIGYWVGRRAGRPFLARYGRFVHIKEKQLRVMDYYFSHHGGKTVFFGRWVSILRAGAALFAGASRMPWPKFALWNALGSVAWAVGVTLLGYFFSASIGLIKSGFGYAGIAALVAALAGAYLFFRRTERRLFRDSESAKEQGDTAYSGDRGEENEGPDRAA